MILHGLELTYPSPRLAYEDLGLQPNPMPISTIAYLGQIYKLSTSITKKPTILDFFKKFSNP